MCKNKEAYRQLCQSEADIPVFLQPWWLDVVCERGNWEVCLTFDKGGEITGALPIFRTRFRGFQVIRMPLLTPFLGAWLKYPPTLEKPSRRYAFEHRVLNELIRQLPRVAYFTQNFHYGMTNWLPFYWQGFRQTTFYSYVIENISNSESVFKNFEGDIRTEIRKAEKNLTFRTGDDFELFWKLNQLAFKNKGLPMPYSKAFFRKVDDALKARDKRRIYFAEDEFQNVHAAIYLLLDNTTTFYLASGRNEALDEGGAVSFLIWEALKDLSGTVQAFDFEGSIIPGIENFFRSFGGVQKPYFQIYKGKNRFFDLLKLLVEK